MANGSKNTKKIVISIAAAVMLIAGALLISRFADMLDTTTENDVLIEMHNTKLPEGIELYSESSSVRPAMWQVTAKDGGKMYMLGSMHALPKSAYPIAGLKECAEQCDAFAFEAKSADAADLFDDTDVDFPDKLDEGDELKNHLSESTYAALSARAKNLRQLNKYRPWYVYTELDSLIKPDPNASASADELPSSVYGIDRLLEIEANILGKEKLEVESHLDKKRFYPEMPEDILDKLIADQLSSDDTYDVLYKAWASGDMETIYKTTYGTDGLEGDELATKEKMIDYFITKRNAVMTGKAEEYLKSGKTVLFIVGATHFYGDDGIAAQLEKKGYTVERLQ